MATVAPADGDYEDDDDDYYADDDDGNDSDHVDED